MQSQLVSILTPSFNQAAWLGDNLKSVSSQTHLQIEHIVMDGGSTDETIGILRHAAPSLTWKSEPDRGQSDALNKAFAASSGEIIGWLNSDDGFVDRRAVEWAVKAFERHPDVGVVYGHSLLVNASNQVLQIWWSWPPYDCILDLMTPFAQPSVFMRRSVLGEILVDESLHFVMDFDLWRRLRNKTKFLRIGEILSLDRHQPARKVLSPGYPIERDEYRKRHGLRPDDSVSRMTRKTLSVSARLVGSPMAITARSRIDAAIDLKWEDNLGQLKYQLLTPRRKMPSAIG